MDTQLLTDLLDERNTAIWEQTIQAFPVQVQAHPRTHHIFAIGEQQGYIFLAERDRDIAPFTHELLHLYLRAKRIFLTEYLIRQMRDEPLLQWTFSASLFEQIGHYLEHLPMLSLFLQAGLERQSFITDYKTPVCNPMLLQLIEGGLQKPVPSIISADLFIRTFIRIKCHPDNVIHYGFYLQRLKEINPALNGILHRFCEAWQRYKIDAYHPDHYSYTGFSAAFMHELGAWTIRSIHTKEKSKTICHT